MVTDKREEQVYQLIDSLSGIDGDLLLDVEPAKPLGPATRPAFAWRGWASLAAGFVLLLVSGFVIRQFLWDGAGSYDRASLPEAGLTGEGEYYEDLELVGDKGLEQEGQVLTPGGSPESIDPLEVGALSYADKTARVLLAADPDANVAYSPAGLQHSLLFYHWVLEDRQPDRAGRELVGRLAREEGLLSSFDNILVIPPALADGLSPSFYEGLENFHYQILEGRGALDQLQAWNLPTDALTVRQKLDSTIGLTAISTSDESAGAFSFFIVQGASVYRSGADKALVAELALEKGRLSLLLPDRETDPEDFLRRGDLFSFLDQPSGRREESALRLPQFELTGSYNWLADDSLELFGTGTDQEEGFASISQEMTFKIQAIPALSASCAASLVDFDRPFIFALWDDEGLPLLAGIVRDPFISSP